MKMQQTPSITTIHRMADAIACVIPKQVLELELTWSMRLK